MNAEYKKGNTIFDLVNEDKLKEISDLFFTIRMTYSDNWYPFSGYDEWWTIGTDEDGDQYEDNEVDASVYGPFPVDDTKSAFLLGDKEREIFTAHGYPLLKDAEGEVEVAADITLYDGFNKQNEPVTYIDFHSGSFHQTIPFITWYYQDPSYAAMEELTGSYPVMVTHWKEDCIMYFYDAWKNEVNICE